MGLFSRMFGDSSVLFTGQKVGDVTAIQAISESGDLYVTKRGAYIRTFMVTKFPHLLPKLILDKLFL